VREAQNGLELPRAGPQREAGAAGSACLQERTLPGSACRAQSQSACLPQGCSSGGSAAFCRCSICAHGEAEVRRARVARAAQAGLAHRGRR